MQDTTKSALGPLDNLFDDPASYGTTREEFKLWVDYIFDWFGATLEKRLRRYAVAALFATAIFAIGLLIALPFGLAEIYLTTPGVYFFWIGIAWCFNALRWLSQTYHLRTNRVRPCFEIADNEYKKFVSPFAKRATENREIFLFSIPYAVGVWIYTAVITFNVGRLGSVLLAIFPRSFPPIWHSGGDLLPKMIIFDFLCTVAIVHVYTGARLTLATTPLYFKFASLPIVPVPNLVSELFQGVLDLYLVGALMWSFGIVLAELLYDARLDILSVSFVIVVVCLGIVAFLLPRVAVRNLWRASKDKAIKLAIRHYYSTPDKESSFKSIVELNEYMQVLSEGDVSQLDASQIISLVTGQLLPVVPLFLNQLVSQHLPL